MPAECFKIHFLPQRKLSVSVA